MSSKAVPVITPYPNGPFIKGIALPLGVPRGRLQPNPHAAALVKKRWQKMTKVERSAYGRKMARARWGKGKK